MPSIRGILLFPVTVLKQFGQIFSGLWSFVREAKLETFVPEWLLRLTVHAIPKALWGDTPEDQIEGSIILIGWSIATSLFTGFLTAGFVLFWGLFLMIGIVRFSDWGSSTWSRVTSPSLPGKGSGGSYKTRRK
ncbi:hypothetical protein [Halomontanus rarus]|uniref:hypothetical protein n=1 Tax=Halomontanus rarus TaxID=3034020 RepID=UPI0023E8B8E7|nr:hypothetical protein [Halovivax sp. TS33]